MSIPTELVGSLPRPMKLQEAYADYDEGMNSSVTNAEVKAFWEDNPVAAEGIGEAPGTPGFFRAFDALRVSPDGTQIAYALEQEDGRRQIWIHAFASGRRVQVTRDGDHWAPIWSRDGSALVYAKGNASGSEVVRHPLNGEAVTLARSTNRLLPSALTPDSQTLILTEAPPTDEFFISQLDMRRPGTTSK